MAHKKGVGSTDNGRDSKSKRLDIKLFGGQTALAGNIIVRQRGTKYHAGQNVYMGRDHTLHASIDGVVTFKRAKDDRSYVSVLPAEAVVVAPTPVNKKPKAGVPATTVQPSGKKEAPAPVVEAPEAVAAPEAPVAEIEAPVAVVAEETAAEVEAPAAEEAKPAKKTKAPKLDDLKIVEGIGPKIEELLKNAGIDTWEKLADAPVDQLREVLDAAGSRYQIHDPSTWPAQARFAANGQWDELKEYQDMLIGGRDVAE